VGVFLETSLFRLALPAFVLDILRAALLPQQVLDAEE
jgi:hypothetical protein